MIPNTIEEAPEGGLPSANCSPSSDLGYDAELTTAQLHAQWVAKYEQVQELWNIDNCQKNDRIKALETAIAYEIRLAEKQIELLKLRLDQGADADAIKPFGSNLHRMVERLKAVNPSPENA